MTKSAFPRFFAAVIAASFVLAACGGGGGGTSPSPVLTSAPTSAPVATPTPATTVSQQISTSTTTATTATATLGSDTETTVFPPAGTATAVTTTFSTTQPSGTATIQSIQRRPANIGASPIGAIAFVCVTPAATTTFGTYPSFTLTLPSSVAAGITYAYVALYDPTRPSTGWNTIEGPATISGTTLSFSGSGTTGGSFVGGDTYCFMIFTLASALPTATPTAAATAAPTAAATANAAAFTCPSSDAATAVAAGGAASGTDAVRRTSGLRTALPVSSVAGRLEVTYDASAMSGREAAFAARESAAGASLVQSFSFSHVGKVVHVLSVPPSQVANIAATLRSQSGVESVTAGGTRRFTTAVTTPYYPNDPYFEGFATTVSTGGAGSATPAPTLEQLPYVESANVPGQWDMHAIQLEHAFGYSQPNSATKFNANALGSSNVKIAIIDTGEDPHHPELASKIAYQKCYITNATGTVQSTSIYETDPQGHGTDVAGIAAAATNDALGFAGAGGATSIYAYRVFPTPDDACANDTTSANDSQCGADTADIAAAINDAVAQGVNVISMSLGGSNCDNTAPNGDSDTLEGHAVANAIAANIVVVAASGNSAPGTAGVSAPACDTGVIAVGATSLADGQTNGSNVAGGSPTAPVEYVASYSQYGTVNTYQSASSWGIVAPGGDPSGNSTDNDDLHWIENIWTSTPFMANASDTTYQGECTGDYPNDTGTTDCRTLIAGTSMSTPHVAGVAALIIAVAPSYGSPTAMKTLLCETADNLGTTYGAHQGCGRLNAYKAMAMALGDSP